MGCLALLLELSKSSATMIAQTIFTTNASMRRGSRSKGSSASLHMQGQGAPFQAVSTAFFGWTFPNVIPGQIQAEGVILSRMNADLMFENDDMTQVYVSARVRDPLTKKWIEAPRCAFEMLMFKTG